MAQNLDKANKRDKARNKKNKMIVDNKSIFIIQQSQINRAEKSKKKENK